jgi:hypothetical protein
MRDIIDSGGQRVVVPNTPMSESTLSPQSGIMNLVTTADKELFKGDTMF